MLILFCFFEVYRWGCTHGSDCRVSWWPRRHRDALTSGPWWVALVLCLSHMRAQIVYSPFLRLSLTCVHTQSELEWKHSSRGRQTNNTLSFSLSFWRLALIFFHSYFPMFSPSSLHLCCWYHNISPVPSAPGTNYHRLSTATTGCLCLSLTPYGPLCMFGCMTPVPSPLPSDLQIETRSGLIFPL